MRRAGIAEAKNSLSALLDRVRSGESVIIEDRGVPVARLESVMTSGRSGVAGRVARLQRQGVLRPALGRPALEVLDTAPPTPRGGVTASGVLVADRRNDR